MDRKAERVERGGSKKKDRKGDKKGIKKGKRKGYKVGFWNVAGLENKDREFWESLKEWDVIFLSETWI